MARMRNTLLFAIAAGVRRSAADICSADAPAGRSHASALTRSRTDGKRPGPDPRHVGHREIAQRNPARRTGRQMGASWHLYADALSPPAAARSSAAPRLGVATADGRLRRRGVPSHSNSVTHTWRITGGTGLDRDAAGPLGLLDLGDREIAPGRKRDGDHGGHAGTARRQVVNRTVPLSHRHRSEAESAAALEPSELTTSRSSRLARQTSIRFIRTRRYCRQSETFFTGCDDRRGSSNALQTVPVLRQRLGLEHEHLGWCAVGV